MERRCFIFGAGEFDKLVTAIDPGDLIIAADGGYNYLRNLGKEPDILIGDFDSLGTVPEHQNIVRYPAIKDDTDMALAVSYAEEAGCTLFFLYGGIGGRLDHTLANIQLLTGMARKGFEAYLVGNEIIITVLHDGGLEFSPEASGIISVFCIGEEAFNVSEKGLKYTLGDAVLGCERALGVSNEFIGEKSSIEVKKGTLLILWDARNGIPARYSIQSTGIRRIKCCQKNRKGSSDEKIKDSV